VISEFCLSSLIAEAIIYAVLVQIQKLFCPNSERRVLRLEKPVKVGKVGDDLTWKIIPGFMNFQSFCM